MFSVFSVPYLKYHISSYHHLHPLYLRHILPRVPCDLGSVLYPNVFHPPHDHVLERHFCISVSPPYVPSVLNPMFNVLCPAGPCVPYLSPQHPPLTLSSVVRSPSLAWIPKAMRQMAAATHMRHCRPPASCRANLMYSGVPFGGRSALGPSRSSSSAARLADRPWGRDRVERQWLLRAFLSSYTPQGGGSSLSSIPSLSPSPPTPAVGLLPLHFFLPLCLCSCPFPLPSLMSLYDSLHSHLFCLCLPVVSGPISLSYANLSASLCLFLSASLTLSLSLCLALSF